MTEHVKITGDPPCPVTFSVGGSSTVNFDFAFPFWESGDIIVYVDGVLRDPSTYTVTGYNLQGATTVVGGYGSGRVTLNAGVTNKTVIVDRMVVLDRDTDFSATGALSSNTLNSDLDRLTAREQDLKRQADRTLLVPYGEDGFVLPTAAARAGTVAIWGDDGLSFDTDRTLTAFDAAVASASTNAATAVTQAGVATAAAATATSEAADAADSADSASTSAGTATTQAGIATDKADEAATSATAAATAETNAETAQAAAETAQAAAEAAQAGAETAEANATATVANRADLTFSNVVDTATARQNLGVEIGADVLAYDATVQAWAGVTVAADKGLYATGADAFATFDLTAFSRSIQAETDAAGWRETLGAAPTTAGYARNEFYNSLDPEHPDIILFSGNVSDSFTATELTDLGFTTGVERGSNSAAIYAINLADELTGTEYIFARVYVQAASAGAFGTPRIFFYTEAGATHGNNNLTLETEFSSTVRSYIFNAQVDPARVTAKRIGLGVSAAPAGLIMGAGQFAIRPFPIEGIDLEDYGGVPTLSAASLAAKPDVEDTAAENMFRAGNYPDQASKSSLNAYADVTDSDLTALGLTRGVTQGGVETSILYGESISRTLIGNEYYFARVYVETGTADDFGTPRLYFYKGRGAQLADSVNMTLEEKFSSTAAVYTCEGQVDSDVIGANWMGVGCASAFSGLIVCGGQFAVSPRRIRALNVGDYPVIGDANEPIYPTHLFLREGRRLPFYPQNVMQRRADEHDPVVAGFCSLRTTPDRYAASYEPAGQIVIDADECGAAGTFDFRQADRGYSNRRRVDVTILTAPATDTGSPNLLFIGDSLTNRGTADLVRQKMEAAGLTPSFIGTLVGRDESGTNQDGTDGEGREGKKATEYVYIDTTLPPVAPGDEATYQADSHANKVNQNPFLKADDASYDPGVVQNGYAFDMAFYLSRFSYADPDAVIICLGTNDITDDFESAPALIEQSLEIMIDQTRAALATAKILVWFPCQPRSSNGDARWERGHRETIELLNTLIRNKRAGGDSNVYFVPVYAHMSAEVGWEITGTADADTGVLHAAISDTIHFGEGALREQMVEVLTNAIMAVT